MCGDIATMTQNPAIIARRLDSHGGLSPSWHLQLRSAAGTYSNASLVVAQLESSR